MEIFGFLAFIYLINQSIKIDEDKNYNNQKKQWRLECLKDDRHHFVGITPGLCEICGKQAKVKWKNGQAISWKW